MTKRTIRDPYGLFIVKEEGPTEEEQLSRQRYYEAEMALLKQEKAIKERRQVQIMNEQAKILSASISTQQRDKQAQSKRWQFDLHDFIVDRGFR